MSIISGLYDRQGFYLIEFKVKGFKLVVKVLFSKVLESGKFYCCNN